MADTYHIHIARGRTSRKFDVVGSSNKDVETAMSRLFRGRFKRPDALKRNDGVRLVVVNSSNPSLVMDRRIYNKSVVQVEIAIKNIIKPL